MGVHFSPPSQFHPFNKTILAYLVAIPTRSTNLCGAERGGGTKVNTHGKRKFHRNLYKTAYCMLCNALQVSRAKLTHSANEERGVKILLERGLEGECPRKFEGFSAHFYETISP